MAQDRPTGGARTSERRPKVGADVSIPAKRTPQDCPEYGTRPHIELTMYPRK